MADTPKPDTILGRPEFGIDPETNADKIVKVAPQIGDAGGEIVGDPGRMNPWGTGPGFGYGIGTEGLNWRNIKYENTPGEEFGAKQTLATLHQDFMSTLTNIQEMRRLSSTTSERGNILEESQAEKNAAAFYQQTASNALMLTI